MAVLRMDAADPTYDAATAAAPGARPGDAIGTLLHLASGELPDDVRECEVTVVALFRASLMLNFVTGGKPQMTFSARAWRSRRTARNLPARFGWSMVIALVDSSCGVLRGERDHCEVAWVNYVRRPKRLTRQALRRRS